MERCTAPCEALCGALYGAVVRCGLIRLVRSSVCCAVWLPCDAALHAGCIVMLRCMCCTSSPGSSSDSSSMQLRTLTGASRTACANCHRKASTIASSPAHKPSAVSPPTSKPITPASSSTAPCALRASARAAALLRGSGVASLATSPNEREGGQVLDSSSMIIICLACGRKRRSTDPCTPLESRSASARPRANSSRSSEPSRTAVKR